MKSVKRKTPAAGGNRRGRQNEKHSGAFDILLTVKPILPQQILARITRARSLIAGAIVAGAPR